jgi:hypothetical protein
VENYYNCGGIETLQLTREHPKKGGKTMRNLFLVLVSIIFFSGCASFSNYQTAQVLQEDERQFGVGLTFTKISPEEGVEVDYEDITYFTPELMFRTGVARNFDFGAKLYSSFPVVGIVIDGKYQLTASTSLLTATPLIWPLTSASAIPGLR